MATSNEVPGRFPVAIDGRTYMADLNGYQRKSLDLFRQQADGGREFDEGSLNPEDLWRRSQVDWRMGAGGEFLDRGAVTDVARQRFDSSFGIDPWVEGGKLQLQRNTEQLLSNSGGTNGTVRRLFRIFGKHVYVAGGIDGVTNPVLKWRNATTGVWSDFAAGHPTGGLDTLYDACTDGTYLYTAWGAGGVYRASIDGAAPVKLNDVDVHGIAFVRGRLLAWSFSSLYNITDVGSTTAPDPLVTLGFNQNWQCFGASSNYILGATTVSSSDGGKTVIHRITVRDDGTALTSPTPCAELPDGETVQCIVGYVGVVLLGTSRGIRIGQLSGGELTYGPLLEVGSGATAGVDAIEPQGNYAWFRWQAQDNGASEEIDGLGRLDLSRFTDDLMPAYASDAMPASFDADITQTNNKGGVAVGTQGDRIAFTIVDYATAANSGVWETIDDFVASGWIKSGVITFGVADPKVPEQLTVIMDELPAGATVVADILDAKDGTVLATGTASTAGDTSLTVSLSGALANPPEGIQVKLTLTRATDPEVSPVVTRWTLFANPLPRRGERFVVPLVLRTTASDHNGRDIDMDPYAEFLALKAIEAAGLPIDYQEFGQTYRAFIDAIQFGPELEYDKNGKPQGLCFVSMRVFE